MIGYLFLPQNDRWCAVRRSSEHLPDQRSSTTVETPPDCDVFDFDDAVEFLHGLSPMGDLWCQEARQAWIFRGQADAAWKLIPSAHRAQVLETWLADSKCDSVFEPALTQQQRELSAVLRFVEQCRASSIDVPEDGQVLRGIEREEREKTFNVYPPVAELGEEWPPVPLASLFAIAQHHGVPTRLLDWSRSPYVAAYFAARDAAEQHSKGDHRLAVWAFDHGRVTGLSRILSPGMRLVEAPHDGNPFLRAQKGVFTVVQNNRVGVPASRPETLYPFGEVVSYAWWYLPTMGASIGSPWVRKLTLPQSCSGEVLRLLDRLDINAASLFPNHGGVALALRERRFWR